MVFDFANSCEKRARLVESDPLGNFHLLENSIVLDKNSTLSGHVEDDSDDTGHSETQGAGAGSDQYADTSFNHVANFAELVFQLNLFEEEQERPNEDGAEAEEDDSFHEDIRDALADSLDA